VVRQNFIKEARRYSVKMLYKPTGVLKKFPLREGMGKGKRRERMGKEWTD